jgi:hypothetical protein
VSAAGAWSRATDADVDPDITPGMMVLIEGGTLSADLIFICTNPTTVTIGVTAISFQAIALATTFFVGKTVSGTSYTAIISDAAKRLYLTNAGTKTITVPPQTGGGGVAFPVNTEIELCNIGAGLATVALGAGVTVNSLGGILTIPQYHCVKLKKRANPNTWELTGVLLDPRGKQTISVPASAMLSATTSGPASAQVETTTNDINFMVLDFDASSDEHAHFNICFPLSWDEGTVTFQYWWTTTASDTDGVAFGLQAIALSDNDVADTAWGTPVVVTDDAQGAAGEILVSAESAAVTIGGTPAAGDIVFFRFFRDVSDGNDDMSEDARLIAVKVFYTTNAVTDA